MKQLPSLLPARQPTVSAVRRTATRPQSAPEWPGSAHRSCMSPPPYVHRPLNHASPFHPDRHLTPDEVIIVGTELVFIVHEDSDVLIAVAVHVVRMGFTAVVGVRKGAQGWSREPHNPGPLRMQPASPQLPLSLLHATACHAPHRAIAPSHNLPPRAQQGPADRDRDRHACLQSLKLLQRSPDFYPRSRLRHFKHKFAHLLQLKAERPAWTAASKGRPARANPPLPAGRSSIATIGLAGLQWARRWRSRSTGGEKLHLKLLRAHTTQSKLLHRGEHSLGRVCAATATIDRPQG